MKPRPAAAVPPSLLLLLLALVSSDGLRSAAAAAAPKQQHAVRAPQSVLQQHLQQRRQAAILAHHAAAAEAEAAATEAVGADTIAGAGAAAAAEAQPRASPAVPELLGYTFNTSKDTFQLCHETSGLNHDIPLEELLPKFKLPADLTQRKSINLAELMDLLHTVQPTFKLVYEPMLFGEADIGGLLSPGGLPRLVHFTVKDKDQLRPHHVVSMASWAHYNPGHSLMLFDDDDIRNFMTSYYPDLLPTFDGLGTQVERTDMWRYLVLCRMGGVYADSDVVAARPVTDWVQDAGLLVGIENVFTTPEEAKRRDYSRQVQMVQWTIASRKGHPVVCRMGQYVAQHVKEEAAGEFVDPDRDHAILERTGPGIWSSSVHDYISEHGVNVEDLVAGGKVGDVRVLPQPVFGCASATFNPEEDTLPYAYHMFKGSWKSKQPSKVVSFISTLYKKLHAEKKHQQASEREAAIAAAAALAMEAAEFARRQQVQPVAAGGNPSGTTAAAAAGANGNGRSGDSAVLQQHPHPRLPILDEQILEHKRQQLLQQEEELQAKAAAAGLAAPGTAAAPVKQQRRPVRLAVAADVQQNSITAVKTAADTRKLRSSQLMLVRGLSPADAAGVALAEPELPSSALSSMPALSVLVLVVLVCAVYKQQQCSLGFFNGWGGRAAGSRGCSSMRTSNSGSSISRPGSRMTLCNGGSAAMLLPGGSASTAGSLSRPPLPDRQALLLPEQEVCYASSQSNGNPHRHKRSWGSSSNFQQL